MEDKQNTRIYSHGGKKFICFDSESSQGLPLVGDPIGIKAKWSTGRIISAVIALVILAAIASGFISGWRGDQNSTSDAKASATRVVEVPNGFQGYRDQVDNFIIAAPSNWTSLNLYDPNVAAAAEKVLAENPRIKEVSSGSGGEILKNTKLEVFSPSQDSWLNVVVWSNKKIGEVSWNQLMSASRSTFENAGMTVNSVKKVEFASRPAIKSVVSTQLRGESTQTVVTQFLVPVGDTAYAVTLYGSDPQLIAIASSFTILD